MRDLFPGDRIQVNELFPEGASHLRLCTDEYGACVFLSDTGCILPRPNRPLYCKIFPFWIKDNAIHNFAMPSCLAQKENIGRAGLLRCFNQDENRVRLLYEDIRAAWGFPRKG
jgi:Fe-S-cluster containining protein